jgi:hypothetical protein
LNAAPILIVAIVLNDFNYFEFFTQLQATAILWQLDFIALFIYVGHGENILWGFRIINLAWLRLLECLVH